ncbi:Uncharacterized protein QTN25_008829 [Entamoeba marina]
MDCKQVIVEVAKKEREVLLRNRKRLSRNDETIAFNAMLNLLVIEGFNVELKKSKKTIHTVKMLIPEYIEQPTTGIRMNQQDICKLSNKTKEAQMNNGILYLLNQLGYSFIEKKKTKRASVTERLIRISQMIKDDVVITKNDLMEMGESFHNCIPDTAMGSIFTITPSHLTKNSSYYRVSSPIPGNLMEDRNDGKMKLEQEYKMTNSSETLSGSSSLVYEEPFQMNYFVSSYDDGDEWNEGFVQKYLY